MTRVGLAPWLVAAVTAGVFARSVGLGFVEWDDHALLVESTGYQGVGPAALWWMATSTLLGHYAPVTWASFALDWLLWGLDPVGFHVTNVGLHAATAALVCHVGGRLVERATGWPAGRCQVAGAVAALLWAVHPLRVEAVSWLTGRRDVLSGCLVLLALGAYVRAASGGGRRWLGLAVGAYVLAAGAKAVVMALPVGLVALEVYPLGGLSRDPRRWLERADRAAWRRIAPLGLVGAATAVGAYLSQGAGSTREILGLGRWLGKVTLTVGIQLQKMLVPLDLSPVYEMPAVIELGAAYTVAAGTAGLGVTLLVGVLGRRWPAGLVAWAWWLAFLAPVTAMAHAGPQVTADRYSYLPALGPAVLAGAAVAAALRPSGGGRRPGPGRALAVLGVLAAVVVALAGATWRQQGVWRDPETLWAHAVRATPECVRCHVNRGNRLAPRDPAGAMAHYARALALDPSRVEVHANVGLLLLRTGRPDEAIPHFRAVLARHPARLGVHASLARALVQAGRLDEAATRLDEAGHVAAPAVLLEFFRELSADPASDAVARLGLFQAHVRVGDREAAARAHRALAAAHPELARVAAARAGVPVVDDRPPGRP